MDVDARHLQSFPSSLNRVPECLRRRANVCRKGGSPSRRSRVAQRFTAYRSVVQNIRSAEGGFATEANEALGRYEMTESETAFRVGRSQARAGRRISHCLAMVALGVLINAL
jgi:plasmid replication initiation protein